MSPIPMRRNKIAEIKTKWMAANYREILTAKNTFRILGNVAMLFGIIKSYVRSTS